MLKNLLLLPAAALVAFGIAACDGDDDDDVDVTNTPGGSVQTTTPGNETPGNETPGTGGDEVDVELDAVGTGGVAGTAILAESQGASGTAVTVTAGGVYYIPCVPPVHGNPETVTNAPVRVRDPGTGRDREVGTLEAYEYAYRMAYSLKANVSGFAVSPDGLAVLYSRMVNSGADLMMIENFR